MILNLGDKQEKGSENVFFCFNEARDLQTLYYFQT